MIDKQLFCHVAVFIGVVSALSASLLTYVLCKVYL